MKTLFGLLGLLFGAGLDASTGAMFGLAIGILTGAFIQSRDRINDLEKSIETMRSRLDTLLRPPEEVKSERSPSIDDLQNQVPESDSLTAQQAVAISLEILPDPNFQPASTPGSAAGEQGQQADTLPAADFSPGPFEKGIDWLRDFFTTGNVVVKVAVIILFFGVSFLIKYAAERNMLPIELRLVGIAAFAVALLVVGWRLQTRNRLYALVLQGGAVGMLYLTVFSAGRLDIMPMALSFALLCLLVVASCWLALKQDAKSLALFATTGGFLAPILTATGEGSHVALFSYYALLNLGIFAIAWFKSWRSLNWLGFVFTFVIGSMWGIRYYQPEYFSSTQPFLILFFVFYLAISILFALHQAPDLRGVVDGSLVFGTPLVGFTLQSQLVRDFDYGHAWSTLVIGLVYLGLYKFLKEKSPISMQALCDAFLALAVVFLTLTIPFTVDGHWTAAAWALEGAGILWIGLRQQQSLAKYFGLLLQLAAAGFFLQRNDGSVAELALINSRYIGCVMISVAALFSAYQYSLRERLSNIERQLPSLLFYWAMLWWFGSNLHEMSLHLAIDYQVNVALMFITLSCLGLVLLAQALHWTFPEKNAVALLPVIALFVLLSFVIRINEYPLARLGFIAWPLAFAVQYLLLYRNQRRWNCKLLAGYHSLGWWLIVFIVSWLLVDAVQRIAAIAQWAYLFWGLVPVAIMLLMAHYRKQLHWPLQSHAASYFGTGSLPVLGYLVLWFLLICGERADPAPLPYLPILNPQDIAQLLVLVFLLRCRRHWCSGQMPKLAAAHISSINGLLGMMGFVWLNALIARSVHFYAAVDFELSSMLSSAVFQATISIVWTLIAFVLMVIASRRTDRQLWYTGAALLAVVVIKLFLIDLADSGTVTRIISFLSVGGLMLIIGYRSPIPPRAAEQQAEH